MFSFRKSNKSNEDVKEQTENWSSELSGTRLTITGNKIAYISSKQGNGYLGLGSKLVTNGQHEWIVKVYCPSTCYNDIGIRSSFSNLNSNVYNAKFGVSYYCNYIYGWTKNNQSSGNSLRSVRQMQSGDVIKILLDIEKKQVSFYNPSTSKSPLYTVPNLPDTQGWRLACYMSSYNNQSIEIISSKGSFDIVSLEYVIQTVKSASNSIKNNPNKITKQIKSSNLEALLQMKEDIVKFKNNYTILDELLKLYAKQISDIDNLLDKQIKPDPKNYKNWTAQDLCRFIVSLENGRFNKYGKVLEKNLIENGVKGSDIKDITKNDLIPFGVTNFSDRTAIFKELTKLTNN